MQGLRQTSMNENYPSAVKLTNDKTSRASGEVGVRPRPSLKDGEGRDASHIRGRCDAVEAGESKKGFYKSPSASPRTRRKRISRTIQ